ncbi:MAG TPA: hypothetical protein VGB74_20710, partial [Actinoplanes sp.]
MARLVLTPDEAVICQLIGVRAFMQARVAAADGELADVRWDSSARQGRAIVRGEPAGWVTASIVLDAKGKVAGIDGECTCGLAPDCVHPAALVLVASQDDISGRAVAPSWESALATLLKGDSAEVAGAALALQFDLEEEGRGRRIA